MPLTVAQLDSLADAITLLMGVGDDEQVRDQAKSAVYLVTVLAKGYCRGVGFGEENGEMTIAEEIQGVIITAATRLVANPSQASSESESAPVLRIGASGAPIPGPGKDEGPEI